VSAPGSPHSQHTPPSARMTAADSFRQAAPRPRPTVDSTGTQRGQGERVAARLQRTHTIRRGIPSSVGYGAVRGQVVTRCYRSVTIPC
jgi:hypothetical protein